MKYLTPLRRRISQADQLRRRYRDDPVYRLHKVNSARTQRGLPPHKSLDDAKLRVVEQ